MEDCRPGGSASIHIFCLPVEVLQYIFEQAILSLFGEDPFSRPKSLDSSRFALSSVCSWWRDIVINHHILWASISYSYVNNDGSPPSLNWIRLCLRRSGRHSLHLAMDFTGPGLDRSLGDLSLRGRNSTIGQLISFLDTVEDDVDRVSRLSVRLTLSEYLSLIIPRTRIPKLRRLLVVVKYGPVGPIDAMMLGGLVQLDICAATIHRTALVSLLAQCPSLRHFSLHTKRSPKICQLGQSSQPLIRAPRLQSIYLRGCVLPARAFDAPELTRLLASPHHSMGRSDFWWKTNYFRVEIADHHEEVVPNHFPQLRQLAVGTWWNEMDYLEPSIRLIRAHPDINELSLYGHDGACKLLRNAFRPPLQGHPPTSFGDGPGAGAGAAPQDDTEWEAQVPTALRSLIIHSPYMGINDTTLADAIRHMLLASDVLCITFLIRIRKEPITSYDPVLDYNARDYPDFISLLMEFPGRFSMDTLPLIGLWVECR